jgi:hypothetical protein
LAPRGLLGCKRGGVAPDQLQRCAEHDQLAGLDDADAVA